MGTPEDALRILVVDDDAVDRMAVRRVLKRSSLRIEALHEVDRGAAAIDLLTQETFHCALLDYQLPDMDGLELIVQLRDRGITFPLITLTGQGDEETAVEFMKAGASDYLVKSRLSPELLTQCLRTALRVAEAEQAVRLAQQQLQATNALLWQQNQALEEQRRQIQRQNVELERASRLKSKFLATMSHELRTPLNAIIGFSQLLMRRREDTWTEKQADMVRRIHSNGKNLLTLLNEILDFSKLDARRLELRPERMNLADLVTTTIAEMRSLAEQKSLDLTLTLDLTDEYLTNDPTRLRQVMVNLLSNAIKFTEQGGIHIQVTEAGAEKVVMVVTDTGIGIPPEDLDAIFEAFRQGDQSHSRRHMGTGLGLAIVDSLVGLMGGAIAVESTPAQGTQFRVLIPRHVAPSP